MGAKRILFVALMIMLVQQSIFAQPTNPSPGPIGGAIYLLFAAIGLGVFTLKKKNKH